jgi:hypothetical protein
MFRAALDEAAVLKVESVDCFPTLTSGRNSNAAANFEHVPLI